MVWIGSLISIIGIGFLILTSGCAGTAGHQEETKMVVTTAAKQPEPSRTVPPARDPQIAVEEEYAAAQAKATVEAWDLFLARHGDNRLAVAAREERARLEARKQIP